MAKFTIKRNLITREVESTSPLSKKNNLEILDSQGNVIRTITLRGSNSKLLGDGLISNNIFRGGNSKELIDFIEHFLNTGDYPSKEEAKELYNIKEGSYNNYVKDIKNIMEYNDIDIDEYANNLNQTGIGFLPEGEGEGEGEGSPKQSDRPYTSIDDYLDFDTEGTIGNRL